MTKVIYKYEQTKNKKYEVEEKPKRELQRNETIMTRAQHKDKREKRK